MKKSAIAGATLALTALLSGTAPSNVQARRPRRTCPVAYPRNYDFKADRLKALQLYQKLKRGLFIYCSRVSRLPPCTAGLRRTAAAVRCNPFHPAGRVRRKRPAGYHMLKSNSYKIKAAQRECKGDEERKYACMDDYFAKGIPATRRIQPNPLPTEFCHSPFGPARDPLMPLRCFQFANTSRSFFDGYERQGFNPYAACINMNLGRAATFRSTAALDFAHRLHVASVPDPKGDKWRRGQLCAFVDIYAVNKWGSKADQFPHQYTPWARTKYETDFGHFIPPVVWGPGEPDEQTPPGLFESAHSARCGCLDYATGRLNDVHCRGWDYVLCEYSLQVPAQCIPLHNDRTRCFKLKYLDWTNYKRLWHRLDGAEYIARECHERTPGRLAHIGTEEELRLANKLLAAQTLLKGSCVAVDGSPGPAGSKRKADWKAGDRYTTMADFWAKGQPDNAKGDEACACISPSTGRVHDTHCDRHWDRVICEYNTPMLGLPPRMDDTAHLQKEDDFDLHLEKTCEAMRARIYPYYCPCGPERDAYLRLHMAGDTGAMASSCAGAGGCPQRAFVYMCCERLWLYDAANMGNVEAALLADGVFNRSVTFASDEFD